MISFQTKNFFRFRRAVTAVASLESGVKSEEMKSLHPLHEVFILFMKRCEEMKSLHPLHEEVV